MDAKIRDLQHAVAYATEEVHFTGGLRGVQVDGGWALLPIPGENGVEALAFKDSISHRKFADACGCYLVGMLTKHVTPNSHVRVELWDPGPRDTNGLSAADSWGAVAFRAREAGDEEYANSASYVSLSLKTAGLRLRDVSNGYHEQLMWALAEGRRSTRWFSNIAILDLYVDIHSLASELYSARDHLARIAAIHVGASRKVDSISKLQRWFGRLPNPGVLKEQMAAILLFELGSEQEPGWLRELGAVRNEMLHRIPLGASGSAAGLRLEKLTTGHGEVFTIRMAARPYPPSEVPERQDPLRQLAEMSANMEGLARAAWKLARYPAVIPEYR